MEFLCMILPLFIAIFFGYAVLNTILVINPFPLLTTLALSFGLGMGLITQWMLILGCLGLPYDLWTINGPFLFLSVAAFLWKRRLLIPFDGADTKCKCQTPGSFYYRAAVLFCCAYLCIQLFFVFSNALTIPVYSWDAIYFIAKKAKVFFYDGSMRHLPDFPWAFYPFYVTLAETWYSLSIGQWHETYVKIIFPCTFLSFGIIAYDFLRRYMDQLLSLVTLVIITTSNLFLTHAAISYSDFSLVYFMNISIFLLVLWKQKGGNGLLLLASLFAGFGTFTKLEGLVYFGVGILLLAITLWKDKKLVLSRKAVDLAMFLVPGVCIYGIFFAYKFFYHIPAVGRLWIELGPDFIKRLPVIMSELVNNLLLTNNWGVSWFLFLISTVIAFRLKKTFPIEFLFLFIGIFSGFLIALGLFTTNYLYLFADQSYISLSRLILHIFPLSVVLTTLQVRLWLDHREAQERSDD